MPDPKSHAVRAVLNELLDYEATQRQLPTIVFWQGLIPTIIVDDYVVDATHTQVTRKVEKRLLSPQRVAGFYGQLVSQVEEDLKRNLLPSADARRYTLKYDKESALRHVIREGDATLIHRLGIDARAALRHYYKYHCIPH